MEHYIHIGLHEVNEVGRSIKGRKTDRERCGRDTVLGIFRLPDVGSSVEAPSIAWPVFTLDKEMRSQLTLPEFIQVLTSVRFFACEGLVSSSMMMPW